MSTEYTPTTEVVKDACTFPRRRLGEPRDMTPEAFDLWIASVKAEALREAVLEFEGNVGPAEFAEQSSRNESSWGPLGVAEAWEQQGPYMDWLLNRADEMEAGA